MHHKIIQIATADIGITALCEDGTLWVKPKLDEQWTQVPTEPVAEKPLIYPPEYNMHLRLILGHMCFQLARYAANYRERGIEIPTKAEDEQAFMLDKMLRMFMMHGPSGWIEALNRDMLGEDFNKKKD